MKLIHVCGWSHGLSATLPEAAARRPKPPVEVVFGGLFTGPRRVPVPASGHGRGADAQIAARTGATSREGYERLIADGSSVRDSEATPLTLRHDRSGRPAARIPQPSLNFYAPDSDRSHL
ncbi:hypothetical protein ABZ307_07560 [Streptomyces griseorubiginosus]|uniref:hypothetical protein n=1 Tax=Streptomyces griseorubiginosus TaxID=67304 RepID=UPI0033B9B945